ncbi:hypothetical protein AZ66_04365 [Paenibacillus sp. E194]|jgi:hypothetical protein|uniref:hypothetical protein n=1 Tax=Paenibacillus sp. E194 TaxID=1458845 RepID=UPI0005C8FCAB|nr:hypothetical protein [Paenibacillus sp. E194]KJB88975.1 hypothetical protein AZ66_04365 [Paenibacillus sp. E194]
MLKSTIRYLLRNYSRSYRYIPPLFTFLISLGLFYTYTPNPIMGSFSFTTMLIYVFAAWFSYSFLKTEHSVQEELTILHVKSRALYLIGLICSVALLMCFIVVVAIAYPIVFDKFDEPIRFEHLIVGLFTHLSSALLGIAISLYFAKRVERASYAIGGILLILALSFCQGALIAKAGIAGALLSWVFPPAYHTMNMLLNYSSYTMASTVGTIGLSIGYAVLLMILLIQVLKRVEE